MPSLSVCMMVQNSEKTLNIALESLNYIYDELIIVDGGSNDSTCEIALKYGAKLIYSPWCGNHAQQRNVYLANVKTDWVFAIDSDEFVDNNLIDFIKIMKSSNEYIPTDNFWFPRLWISPNQKDYYIASQPHYPDYQRRLFKYNKNVYYQGLIHETIFNLTHQGEILHKLGIYHLDLFVNSEKKRKGKVSNYSGSDIRDASTKYYLPNMQEIKLEKVDMENIKTQVKNLLNNLSNPNIEKSELNNLIPAEIKNDEFYYTILEIVQREDIKTVLEIGSSSGSGSTEALVKGLRINPSNPRLFCMEVSNNRFSQLVKTYKDDWFVKCYNMSSISLNKFPDKQEIIDFYNSVKTNLNFYNIERILGWLQQDIDYIKNSGVSEEGIQNIKQENEIRFFDFVLIDGSEFTGVAELNEVYGAKYICLDDINTFKNYQNFHRLLKDSHYTLIRSNLTLRNGYAIFERNSLQPIINDHSNTELPINFFTIVLNGQPFIRYHIEIFKQLPFKWHWHIVEGVADLKHDTSWSIKLGGSISDELHKNGLSCDGTTEYIDELAQLYPDNITIYRQPEGVFWDGKREMVNAPLASIQEECLLWQVDVDELWTLEQICSAREMFISNPNKTAAFYWCWYFVGEKLIISTRNCYAQNPQQEWLRTWRFKPGYIWAAHEPPVLVETLADGQYKNVAAENPFLHQETEQHGLVFQHFAYVTQEQLSFKEKYYGYSHAVSQWNTLQKNTKFPILLREYFPWVQDDTQVDIANRRSIVPIAQKDNSSNKWQFLQSEEIQKQILQISKPSPIIIIDGVFFQLYQTGIARVWSSLLKEWANSDFAKHLIVLDRAGSIPKINGIRYITVPLYEYDKTDSDREMLQKVCDEEGAALFISSYYTTPIATPSVFMAYDMIPEVMGWDLRNPMWREKHKAIQHASTYIAISENTSHDLEKCFTDRSREAITVAHCGVNDIFAPAKLEDISMFKNKYGITKPYFILVGAGSGYKNSILFFQAFSQIASNYGFDIVLTGSGGVLAPEYRAYTSGSIVHTLQLSDEDLVIAYSGAVALVYPSKYEGFGMPIIEAMACGCPVITCPNASIPEVAEKAAIYINDDDVDGLANSLCEVQKPAIRQSLVTAGLAQAQKFSWSKMAEIVSAALIDATLLSLNLREINLIIFPDWSQPEDSIGLELAQVIKTLATNTESSKTTLLIDTTSISDEDADLLLSSVTMSLLMEEDLDITDGLEITLLVNLAEIQWRALLPQIHGRIVLEHDNQQAVIQAKAETLTSYELASFSQVRDEEFFFA
ncbi:glycosyltransferase [Anabaena sp. UHCC 0399]|uniref:glycosyltransferase n=1 Tax=Anabaena sp. UHCC 0399 TaxID=3110238 RepID=UPI002B1EF113|nr:glycosyltransferase [Anabaena sp. UHCC 0399]MEA5567123.1 glycosyltransferase [Anabaena sp. UHCC 0399]